MTKARVSQPDLEVSKLLRENRILLGLTQHQAGLLTNVTYQQFHKYENGLNRIAAGRLWTVAQAFKLPIERFFPKDSYKPLNLLRTHEALDLLHNFFSLPHEQRKAISNFARALVEK